MSGQCIEVVANAGVGAFVSGVDLSNFDDAALAAMRTAFAQHSVLFFRDQKLTEQQHIALANRWGDINVNRFFAHVDGYPQIAQVLKEPDQTNNIGGGWHTDHSYDQIPALGSMLYARETPPTGGDTLFASTCAAYDALSDGLKATLVFDRKEPKGHHQGIERESAQSFRASVGIGIFFCRSTPGAWSRAPGWRNSLGRRFAWV